MVLQQRDLLLLRELGILRVADRDQLAEIAGFRSVTRVNVRLLKLVRNGLLKRFYLGFGPGARKTVYSVSPSGAEAAGITYRRLRREGSVTLASDRYIHHQLQVNAIHISIRRVSTPLRLLRWVSFDERLSSAVPIIPDGYCELETEAGAKSMFLEVDLGTETSRAWRKKVDAYVSLATSGLFTKKFGRPQFRVLVVAPTEVRTRLIRKTVSQVTTKIFWFATLENINRDGLWSKIWLRPVGEERQAIA